MEITKENIELAAAVAHEANRLFCLQHGDSSQSHWEAAPEWQKESARKGVVGVYNGNSPKESHESWLAEKKATGWKYGPVKDIDKKEHPCFVEYDKLPEHQKTKDYLFVYVASSVFDAVAK